MVRSGNTIGTNFAKFGFWLSGYYDDFQGSRCIADDSNSPSADNVYDSNATHHGNVLNGEATLNPRYRWSVRDRANNSEFSSSENYLLLNDGIARWATIDTNRLSKGIKWEGRSQLQFPSGWVHPNRLRYDKAGVASTADTFLKFSSTNDTSARYIVPLGDTDASFGRRPPFNYNSHNWGNGTRAGYPSTGTDPDFMQTAHLTGCWMGERIQINAYSSTSGSATAHENNPERIFNPIKSKAGKPFLCVQTYMNELNDNRLNNVGNSGQYRPVIAYDGSLNSRGDGEYFGIRMATHSMNGFLAINQPNGVAINADSSVPPEYVIKVGFPKNTTFGTTGSGGGTPAINWTIRPDAGHGLSAVVPFYHMIWDAGTTVTPGEAWFDLDFKIDYTNNKFKVYHDGTEVTATNATAGAYSGGYTLNNNTQTSAAFKPNEMTGWEMFVTNYLSGSTTAHKKAQINTMIDRVALYKPLTDHSDGTNYSAPVSAWKCSMPANGISQGSIKVLDDSATISLTSLFTDSNISDWRVLLFNGNIDRPIWSSVIEKMSIKQSASDRTREITFSFRDSLSLLDRQIATWEIGQIGFSSDDVINARTSEVTLLSEMMYLGAKRLEVGKPTIGFESSDYKELHGQRTTTSSAFPIQIYNNEDEYGPNNVENEWLGYSIVGINKDSAGDAEILIEFAGTSFSLGDSVEVFGTNDHNVSGAISNERTLSSTGFPGHQTLKIVGLTYTANSSATLQNISKTAPSGYNGSANGIWFKFSSRPNRGTGDDIEVGDKITLPEFGVSTSVVQGVFTVLAYVNQGGNFYVLTDRTRTSALNVTASIPFSLDRGYISPTGSVDLAYRDQHAVWMRDFPDSAWFQKHFGIINSTPDATGTIAANVTTSDTKIQVSANLLAEVTNNTGVGQIVDSDGFVDTFTFTGVADMTNEYLIGVSGLSKDHSSGATLNILTISEDYKHCWVLWSDMRNNGDADADGGFKKNTFGLMKPTAENYEVDMVLTDQLTEEGSYDAFTSLKIGDDLDIWEIDGEIDPSTNAEWSKPVIGAMFRMQSSSGNAIDSDGGRARIIGASSSGSNFAVGDHVHIMEASPYNGTHKIYSISGDNLTLETTATSLVTFDNTVGNWYRKCGGSSDYRESKLADWEDKGGAFIVVDSAKFFNLNTFANYGRTGQEAGGRTDLGDFVTEYSGFPVLIDNYWAQASSTNANNATPFGFHENFRRWLIDTAELNRTINIGDTVIEVKESVSDLTKFADEGFGKIIATRGKGQQNTQEEIYWYVYRDKLDTAVNETATSAASNAGTVSDPLVITCSGADFVTDGVKAGMRVRNVTAKWVAQITSVTATQITLSNTSLSGFTSGVALFQETGSTRSDVQIGDTINIPRQLSEVYLESDAGRKLNSQSSYDLLMGILADNTNYNNGSASKLEVTTTAGTAGAFDKVIIGSSTGSDSALRFLMQISGFIESPSVGTFWMHDKMRAMWSMILSSTWLAQANASLFFDISSIPQTEGMTTDGTNSNFDSFGSVMDARGGKTLFSTIRESVESTGFGYVNSKRLPITYQIGRDNRIEIRPTYNIGEAITRDNLMISSMDASMGGQISNVRVYYNNGASFVDFPEATLNQTYRWKIVEQPTIRSSDEALYIAQEEYNKSVQKSIRIKGEIIRDLDDEDKMLKGRYGYIVDVSRNMERSAVQQQVFGTGFPATSNSYNYAWSAQAGCLFPGSVNALDGNMKANGTDATYKRERHGAGYYAQTSGSGGTDTYDDWYWWWGANSLAHAVQVVHVPTGCPSDSDTTTNDLRVWVALKDNQSGTDIDNAQFTIGLSDVVFDDTPGVRFTSHYGTDVQFAPSYAATINTFSTVDVSKNGFYEIIIPTGYWTTGRPTDPKITVSVNVDYLKALLRRRCGDPTASGILHNAHDITELKTGSWSNTNSDSIFPIGCHKYDSMSGAYGTRYVWYGSRLHVVEDLRWRPATTVTYTDSGLGLTNEPLIINKIDWSITGSDVEQLSLELERDQTKTAGGLISYLFPNVAKGRTSNPSGNTGTGQEGKPDVPPAVGPGGQGGVGNGAGGHAGGTVGPIGSTTFNPNKIEGGHFSTMSKGGFNKTFGANNTTKGLHSKIKGKMKLNNDGLSDNTFGILGQPKPAPATSIQRSIDGLDSSIKPASAGATQTSEGWVFPGVFDPDSSDVFTHEQSIITRVPEDVADEIIGVTASVSLGGTDAQRATLTVLVECEETSSSLTRSFNVSGNTEKATVTLLSSTPLNGANVGGNNIKVTISRTPNSGNDDADNSTVVLHSVKVNFQRSSLFGRDSGTYGFSPY